MHGDIVTRSSSPSSKPKLYESPTAYALKLNPSSHKALKLDDRISGGTSVGMSNSRTRSSRRRLVLVLATAAAEVAVVVVV